MSRTAPAVLVAMLVVVGVACSGHDSHAASSTSSSTTSTTLAPTTTTSQEPAPPGSTSPPTSAPTSAASCRTANLTLTTGILGGAAGTQYFSLAFHNRGAATCVLTGYPGVSFLDASGMQIGPPAQRNTQAHGTVTLGPSTTVYAEVGVGNPDVNQCPAAAAHEVRVFPPNETVAALVAAPTGLQVCTRQNVTASVGPVTDHANG